MRKSLTCVLMMTLLLTGCQGKDAGREAEEKLLAIRGQYLEMTGCSGHAQLRADYGQRVYDYGLDFSWEKEGETRLTLTSPENVAGTVARIAKGETALEFEGVVLATGPLSGEGVTPVGVLPALLTAAREGFVADCSLEGEPPLLRALCRDPEKSPGTGVETELWFLPDTGALQRAELSENGRTVLQCTFTEFVLEGPKEG